MKAILGRLEGFIRDEDAPTMAEYALLMLFVAFGVVVGAALLGTSVNGLFTNAGNEVSNAAGGISLP